MKTSHQKTNKNSLGANHLLVNLNNSTGLKLSFLWLHFLDSFDLFELLLRNKNNNLEKINLFDYLISIKRFFRKKKSIKKNLMILRGEGGGTEYDESEKKRHNEGLGAN